MNVFFYQQRVCNNNHGKYSSFLISHGRFTAFRAYHKNYAQQFEMCANII